MSDEDEGKGGVERPAYFGGQAETYPAGEHPEVLSLVGQDDGDDDEDFGDIDDPIFYQLSDIRERLQIIALALMGADFDLPDTWESPEDLSPEAQLARSGMLVVSDIDALIGMRVEVVRREIAKKAAVKGPNG